MWISPAPAASPGWRSAAGAAAWPLALIAIFHRLIVLAWAGSVTDDFTTVWSATRRFVAGVDVYNENYAYVDPHYLYSPGATLVLSPLGMIADPAVARPIFVAANALAIVGALAWLVRLSHLPLRHPIFPAALAAAFFSEAVTNTLVFSNINGILLLIFVAFIAWMLNERHWSAGVALGLAILIKPMFAPLLILPLMRLQWRTAAAAVALPVVANLAAWPLTPGVGDYLGKLVPYLGTTRDYANSSLAGFAVYFAMPPALHGFFFVVFAAAVVVAVLSLARFRWSDEMMWASLSSGVLLAGVCLLSSLGQAYYSLLLFPAIFTVLGRASAMHVPTTWLGVFLCLSPLEWTSVKFPQTGAWLGTFLPTAGWALFIVSVAAWATTIALCTRGHTNNTAKKEKDSNERKLQGMDRRAMAGEAEPGRIPGSSAGGNATPRHR